MVQKKIFLLSITACYLFLSAIAQSTDPKVVQFNRELTIFLQTEGFKPTVNKNDDGIIFNYNGENHFIKTIYDGQLYFVIFNKIGYLLGGEEGLLPLPSFFAGNDVNAKIRAVKVYCLDDRVVFSIEQYTRSIENYTKVFSENIEILSEADKQFMATYRNIRGNEAIADSTATVESATTYLNIEQSYSSAIAASGGSKTYSVSTDGKSYEILNLPSWCYVESKAVSSFRLVCTANNGAVRSHRIIVRANGIERPIEITQDGKSAQQLTQTSISTQNQAAPFNAPKGDLRLLGLSVGYVQKQYEWKENGETYKIGAFDKENSFLSGIQAGIRIEPLFKYGLGLSTGLFYEYYFSKSDKYTTTYSDSPQEYDYHLNFSEHSLYLPLHLEYRLNFSENCQLFFEAGPSIDFGLSGKLAATEVGAKEPYFTTTNVYHNSETGFPKKRFNASLDFGAGIRVGGGLQLNIGTSRGLLDISSNPNIRIKQNKNLMTSLSWALNDEDLEDFMDKDKNGDYPKHGLTIGYVSKQWEWKTENYVGKCGLWEDSKFVPGFRLGYVYQPSFGYGFGLRTGLNFDTYISVSDDMHDDYGSYYWLFDEMAINVPIHAEYRLHFAENFSLFFETGISVEYGLFAEMEAHGEGVENHKESDLYGNVDWGYPSNRFNLYWDFEGGLRFKKFQISAGSSCGLTPVTFDEGWKVTQNRNLSLGVSYFFW